MELPKVIKVGPHEIAVKFPHKFIERSGVDGVCRHCAETILLADSYNGVKFSDTTLLCVFTHEILHAIANTTGCSAFNNDEDAVDAVAQGLVQVLQDNEEYTRLFLRG